MFAKIFQYQSLPRNRNVYRALRKRFASGRELIRRHSRRARSIATARAAAGHNGKSSSEMPEHLDFENHSAPNTPDAIQSRRPSRAPLTTSINAVPAMAIP
jgi:hypothetical protein